MNTKYIKWEGCVGDGWTPMVRALVDLCCLYEVEILQVKEKFGGLRFYVGSAPDGLNQLIWAAENYSFRICEECGESGKLRQDLDWALTLCDKHHKEHLGICEKDRENP